MSRIVLVTEYLRKIADDYGSKGKGKKVIPSKEEMNALAVEVKRVQRLAHLKEMHEVARRNCSCS
jgi:hypothetical protein